MRATGPRATREPRPGRHDARPVPRARRLRSPLLLTLAALLLLEAVGGIVIFVARLVAGTTPGESLHVLGGLVLVPAYALYQWRHWSRMSPFRPRLDYAIGVLAAFCMVGALVTGLALGVTWWEAGFGAGREAPRYSALLSAAHNIGSMLVLTFVGAHLGAVLLRDRNGKS